MSINDKMTAIANEVRTLSGVTAKLGLDAMTSHIQGANDEIDTHEELISQIQTALQGKAASKVEPVIKVLEVTENGTYIAPNDITGYSPVIVNVQTGDSDGYETGYADGFVNGVVSVIEDLPETLTESDLCGATEIRQYCFYTNNVLKSVELPDTVTKINSNAFYSCSALTSVKLSNNLVEIGLHAFSRCYYVEWGNLVLPRTLKTLGNYAFWHCRKMPQVTIPESVTEMGLEVFNNGYTETVIMESATPPTVGATPFTHTRIKRILVPRSGIDAYKAANNWSAYADKIYAIEDYPEFVGGST